MAQDTLCLKWAQCYLKHQRKKKAQKTSAPKHTLEEAKHVSLPAQGIPVCVATTQEKILVNADCASLQRRPSN